MTNSRIPSERQLNYPNILGGEYHHRLSPRKMMRRLSSRRLVALPLYSIMIPSLMHLCWMLLASSCVLDVVSSFQVATSMTTRKSLHPMQQPRRRYAMYPIFSTKDNPEDEDDTGTLDMDPNRKLYNLLLPSKECKVDQMSGTELGT